MAVHLAVLFGRHRGRCFDHNGRCDRLLVLVHPAWDGDLLQLHVDRLGQFRVLGLALHDLHGHAVLAWDDADLDIQCAAPGARAACPVLGFLGHAGVVHQDHAAAKLVHQAVAGVQHGLGVLGAVLVTGQKAVQGVDHDHLRGAGQHPDLLDHLEVAGGGVEVAAVLGQPHGQVPGSVVVLPGCDPAAQAVVAFTSQVDHIAVPHLLAAPLGHAAGHAQAPVQHHKGLAAARWAVDHDQRLVLNPALDQPGDGGWLGREVVGRDQPVVVGWQQQAGQVVPGLRIIVGIPLQGRHDHARAELGRSLLRVALANPRCVVVSHDHNVLGRAVHLAQGTSDRHQVAGAVGHHHRPAGGLVDGRRRGKALGHE